MRLPIPGRLAPRPPPAGAGAGGRSLVCVIGRPHLLLCMSSPTAVRSGRTWQGRRDSTPQPPVLETGTLPIELLPCVPATTCPATLCFPARPARRHAGSSGAEPDAPVYV